MDHLLAPKWNAVFWRGAISIAFAVTAFAWPIVTLTSLVLLFGFFVLVDGALALSMSAGSIGASAGGAGPGGARQQEPRTRWSLALLLEGLTGIAAGALALFVPGVAVPLLVGLVAVWALATGALEIVAAAALHRDGSTTTALAAGGAASLVVAVVLVAWPALGATAIAWVLGGYALVFGIVLVALAARLFRLAHPHAHHRGGRGGLRPFGGGAP